MFCGEWHNSAVQNRCILFFGTFPPENLRFSLERANLKPDSVVSKLKFHKFSSDYKNTTLSNRIEFTKYKFIFILKFIYVYNNSHLILIIKMIIHIVQKTKFNHIWTIKIRKSNESTRALRHRKKIEFHTYEMCTINATHSRTREMRKEEVKKKNGIQNTIWKRRKCK